MDIVRPLARLQPKRNGVDLDSIPLGHCVVLPAVGQTISIDTGHPAAGRWVVTQLEWQVVPGQGLTHVLVIVAPAA
jgi:hypothetical protein